MRHKKELELNGQIDSLIREFETKAMDKEIQRKIEKDLATLQESLDYLRICIKYMVFDLEATRRENEHLRKLLESGMELGENDYDDN